MRRRYQQPDERGRRFDWQRGLDLFGQRPEVACIGGGLGLLGFCLGQECLEALHSLAELSREWRQVLPLVGGEGATAAEVAEDGADQPDGRAGIVQGQLGEQTAGLAGQLLPQPGLDELREGEVRLITVHHGRTGVDIRLDRIGRYQALAEAVDGGAGHLVERRVCRREIAALLLREAPRQGDAKLGRDFAGSEGGHEGPAPGSAARLRRTR